MMGEQGSTLVIYRRPLIGSNNWKSVFQRYSSLTTPDMLQGLEVRQVCGRNIDEQRERLRHIGKTARWYSNFNATPYQKRHFYSYLPLEMYQEIVETIDYEFIRVGMYCDEVKPCDMSIRHLAVSELIRSVPYIDSRNERTALYITGGLHRQGGLLPSSEAWRVQTDIAISYSLASLPQQPVKGPESIMQSEVLKEMMKYLSHCDEDREYKSEFIMHY